MTRFPASRLRLPVLLPLVCVIVASQASCSRSAAGQRTFDAPEDGVRALRAAVASGQTDDVLQIFGPNGHALVDASDPAASRLRRQVFTAAIGESWYLVEENRRKTLVIGHEAWPFPVPLVQEGGHWRFDTAAGLEEVIVRRIGRNELAATQICRTYVTAQRLYARRAHDGTRPGVYAARFRSEPGRQNGLYWPVRRGQPRSPLGELMTRAAEEPRAAGGSGRAPFHGYYFRILTAQGSAARGGARDYLVNGALSGGFGLVAWPAEYDVTGVMTFIVNHDGVVFEKDLGAATADLAEAIVAYNPDPSWSPVP